MEETKQKFTGETLMSWKTLEFERHERSRGWYFWMAAITVALVGWSFWTGNVLFSLIIIMAAILIFILGEKKPRMMDFSVTNLGIVFGEKFFPYKDIKNFWIAYELPDIKNAYFEMQAITSPRLTIGLDATNPVEVRSTLLEYIKEDLTRDGEPLSDIIARIFKI